MTLKDDQFQFLKLSDSTENPSLTNSTIETPPSKRKFPFTPVLVSAGFVTFVGVLALVYLIKKLKARKNYKDLGAQEREVQLIPNDDQQTDLKPLENPLEPAGIDAQKEAETKEEIPDPEKKEEQQKEEPKEDQKEDQKEEQKNEQQEEQNIEQKEEQTTADEA